MDGSMPPPPPDMELRTIIDKLAQFVARNGLEFESMTKDKQKNNPKFQFLFGGEFYHYYMYKVNAEQVSMRQQQQQYGGTLYQQHPHWGSGGSHVGPWGGAQPSGYQQPPPSFGNGSVPSLPPPPPSMSPGGVQGGGIRSLMDIRTFPPQQQQHSSPTPATQTNVKEMKVEIEQLKDQQRALRQQISESESNLAAQQTVTVEQTKMLADEATREAKWQHLEHLARDTGCIELDEMDTVFQPIIESCTKDSISGGKGWIFNKANSHDTRQLIAHYLAYRVTQESAPFTVKLHLVYLMNDVLHHCLRKGAEDLKHSLESVSVEMFCSGWTAAGLGDAAHLRETRQAKFAKLIKLWEDKSIFSASTIAKMKNPDESWRAYRDRLKVDYAAVVSEATKEAVQTYDNYASQHQTFVAHAEKTIVGLEQQINAILVKIENADKIKMEEEISVGGGGGGGGVINHRNTTSRWDTSAKNKPAANDGDNGQFGPQPHFGHAQVMPDLSRPPPGFPPPPVTIPPGMGQPCHQRQQQQPLPPSPHHLAQVPPPLFDEKNLIPTLPYYDLPAGLMVPLIKLEDSGYRSLNPKDIRLPPPTPPTERLLAALEQFYAPPSHERPRDPDGFEMLGLYEWSKEKANAIKVKADELKAGRRERSPSDSPDPYGSEGSDAAAAAAAVPTDVVVSKRPPEEKRKRYRSLTRTPSPKSSSRRSKSRTRSRSRGSTPDRSHATRRRRGGSYSPSPSPPGGGYSMPSHLTRRSPSPNARRSSKSPPTQRRRRRRSSSSGSSPDQALNYSGYGSSTVTTQSAPVARIDSSNKGHQMLQKMGWSGSGGLGSNESGISEPIQGGDVRDKSELYRGVGSTTFGSDPFEAFRKNKAGTFYTRMKDRDRDKDRNK